MVLRTNLGGKEGAESALLVDTAMQFPIALDDRGWQRAGISVSTLQPVAQGGGRLKHGMLPRVLLGAFDIPQVPAVYGAPLEEFEKGLDVNLDGLAGAGLLAAFRVTLADGGRTLWLEDTMLERPPADDAQSPALPGQPPAAPGPSIPAPSITPPS
jgi:hypothetical protein